VKGFKYATRGGGCSGKGQINNVESAEEMQPGRRTIWLRKDKSAEEERKGKRCKIILTGKRFKLPRCFITAKKQKPWK